MDLEQHSVGSVRVTIIHEPRVDAKSGGELHAAIRQLIDGGDRRIVIDLSAVRFIDSTGLGALVASFKHMGKSGQLVLCGVCDAVVTLFKLTRMDKVFRLFPSREAAVAAIAEV
jgi:anti-sigma B factor antagonist